MSVKYNGKHLAKFIRPEEYDTIFPQVELAHQQLESRSGAGNDFLGWLDLPVNYDKEEQLSISRILAMNTGKLSGAKNGKRSNN